MTGIFPSSYNYIGAYYGTPTSGPSALSGTGKAVVNPGEDTTVSPGRKSSPAECETCSNRKYQDGSDEMVSFKSAAHISPEASATKVRAHEQEHVSNAYEKFTGWTGAQDSFKDWYKYYTSNKVTKRFHHK